ASPVSPQASRSFLVTSKEETSHQQNPTPDAFRWGRHHLGIRGRLFLGIGGRDHFGIRGRIASEFARTSRVPLLRIGNIDAIVIASNWSWQLP
ncbi:hypothetical protein GOB91_32195, partial [Sinorhizobium meliloti]|nr:hypothetical protein [Sinorhizobium meliloti]MDW9733148.1 hypothetical protein [Sinorhizobium meliloti]MDW9787930.1 hypothetical protein [Sinorhizobium meliloti]